jgi:hypothetical protein
MTCKPVLNRGFLRGKTGLHDLRFISLLSLEIQFSKGGPLNLFSCLSHIMTYISNAIGRGLFPSQGHYVFTVFRLLTDFVCLYNYEFWLTLCKIVRSSVILFLPLFRWEVSTRVIDIGDIVDCHTFGITTKVKKSFEVPKG